MEERNCDGVDQDMRILEVKNWKKVALDRARWAKLLKKARAHQRPVEPMMAFEPAILRQIQSVNGPVRCGQLFLGGPK